MTNYATNRLLTHISGTWKCMQLHFRGRSRRYLFCKWR